MSILNRVERLYFFVQSDVSVYSKKDEKKVKKTFDERGMIW